MLRLLLLSIIQLSVLPMAIKASLPRLPCLLS